ncbi:MAG: Maf family protein [Chloroflexota bacterium]
MRLILASRSPRRQEALAALGLDFEIVVSRAEESLPPQPDPTDPVPLAAAKAQDIAAHQPDATVLAGDTIVVVDGQALGKPAGPPEARAMLRLLRGKEHVVRTGLALAHRGRLATAEVACPLLMRAYDETEIERYVASGEPLDCAGAYDVHRQGGALVARVAGCFSAVVGLPIAETARLLAGAGIRASHDPAVVCARLYGRACPAARQETAMACHPNPNGSGLKPESLGPYGHDAASV